MIKAEIVAHSLSSQGDELISVLCTFPRIILAEVNTHRMLSKNTSSSRAIPFKKMVEAVQNNPFIPIAWQKEHKGMQGSEYFTDKEQIEELVEEWLYVRNTSVTQAKILHDMKATKQLVNRLLEPFMWTTMLITGSREGWDNFFHLRCPQYQDDTKGFEHIHYKSISEWYKNTRELGSILPSFEEMLYKGLNKGQAEIHMMALAESIYDAVNESTPKQLKAGEWHIPFENKIGRFVNIPLFSDVSNLEIESNVLINKVKISVAMAARTSYTIVGDEKEVDYEKMIELHDRLLSQDPPHSSPLEHCARAMSDDEYYTFVKGRIVEENKQEDGTCDSLSWVEASGWCYNLKGFIPYRYMIDNNLIK